MFKLFRIQFYILIIVTAFYSTAAWAAGFDCAFASSKTEKIICRSAVLSEADADLNEQYKTAFEDPLIDRNSLKKYVKQFVKIRDRCVRDADDIMKCLYHVYDSAGPEYLSFPHTVGVDKFEQDQVLRFGWAKITLPVADETWPYLVFIYMPRNDNGMWHHSEAYLVIQDRLTEITKQVIYVPKLFLWLDEDKPRTARVNYNGDGDHNYASIDNPDKSGQLAITLVCGDKPLNSYHHMYFIADKKSGLFRFYKRDDCGPV